MFSICLKYSRNYAEAEDNLQDAFLTIFNKISQYDNKGSFEGWIKRITINTALQRYRNQGVFEIVNEELIEDDELEIGQFRLLEVDNPIVLPTNTHVRIIVTASDVLHCWAVPALGVKVDAVPGRLNQGSIFLKRTGIFYGQCSEICGVNHGFMPIVVKSVTSADYINWIISKLES